MVLECRNLAGDRHDGSPSHWNVSVLDRQSNTRYRRHDQVLEEVSFRSARIEASLKRRFPASGSTTMSRINSPALLAGFTWAAKGGENALNEVR